MDRNSSEGNDKIIQMLEQFTRYSVERDYIKQDNRGVRFWIEYSDMCKDKEDVIYYMEENEIGLNSALFYEEICKITESKMDYSQADKYILEGKYKQAQPEPKITELIQSFEQRMESRIQRLRELASLQMFHQNQQSNQKKRKRIEFDMYNKGCSKNYQSNQYSPNLKQNQNLKNNQNGWLNNQYSRDSYKNDIYQNAPYMKQNHKNIQNKDNNIFQGKKLKKKLPDKVYIGDGINIFVDEEYRQQVFPNSTQLVSEYQNVVEEIKDYLDTLPDAEDCTFSSQQSTGQQYFSLSQRQFQSQTMNNSTQYVSKNKIVLLNAINEDMFFPKKSIFDTDQMTSWIGREEKKYKSFELMESQKNSQVVQFNMCDFMQGSSMFSPPHQAEYYLDSYYNNNNKQNNNNKNQQNLNNKNNFNINNNRNSINKNQYNKYNNINNGMNICNQENNANQMNTGMVNFQDNNQEFSENKKQDQEYSLTPIKSQKEQTGIMECESEIYKNGWIFSQSKNYSEFNNYENKQNQQRLKRPQQRFQTMQSTSPLQVSNKRTSQRFYNNDDSMNFQKLDDGNEKQQLKWNMFEKGQVTPTRNGVSVYETKNKANEIQNEQNSRFSKSFQKEKRNDSFNIKQNNLNNIFENLNNKNLTSMSPCDMNNSDVEEKSIGNLSLCNDLYTYNKDNGDESNMEKQQSIYQLKKQPFLRKQFQDYTYDQEDDMSIDHSNLNKAYNDISKFTDDEDEQYSSNFYFDNFQFMKNNSKNSKLSNCVRSRKSSKLKDADLQSSAKISNQFMIDSPSYDKKLNASKNQYNQRGSIEKLRHAHQNNKLVTQIANLNTHSNQSIQFSQELSQVNNILTQDGFFSPSSFDDNIFKINPPPIKNNRKNKNINSAKRKVQYNQESQSDNDLNDEEKSLTEKEDEEINFILDKYCFNNENKNQIYVDENTSNICDELEDKENINLLINQRKSKSQSSMPRKALQPLPIQEFTGESILDNQVLSLQQSFQENEDIRTSQRNSLENDNIIYYSHNQFRNSRNRVAEDKKQIINDDASDKEYQNKYEHILSNSIYKDEFSN